MNSGSGVEIIEESNYYPFGLKHEGYNILTGNAAYQYKYNGKELQETGMYDYGARMYMPDLGRWGMIDPLAEKSRRWSTYNYAYNNPIRFIDPDGRQGKDIIILTANGSFKASKDLMYKTPEGKRLWDKYGMSKTDDIYVNASTFSSKSSRVFAQTYNIEGNENFIKEGKVSGISKPYSAMSSFEGVDISQSANKKVHLMAINESFFPNEASEKYSKVTESPTLGAVKEEYSIGDLTKVVYHEIKAHIEDGTGDADKDHQSFGESTFQGYIRPGSPMDLFDQQLTKTIRTENEKKYEQKK